MHHTFNRALLIAVTVFSILAVMQTTDISILKAEEKTSIRVACIGDSITRGYRIKNRAVDSYPGQLGKMLGKKYEVINYGVNSAALLKKSKKPYWRLKEYKRAMANKPSIVIIKLGTNDTSPKNWKYKSQFVKDYVELIQSFQKLESKPTVWICYPVPAYTSRLADMNKTIKDIMIPMIDKVAEQANVKIIDLYGALSDKPKLFPDGCHPNRTGAKLMAETILKKIMEK
jgi:acyl-CoA thioesterase I